VSGRIKHRVALLVVALAAVALSVASTLAIAAGEPKLRSCGLNANSYVSATRNVNCRTAFRVDDAADSAHGCTAGRTCHVDGYKCRDRLTGRYTFRETCTRASRKIVISGGS
jgi:hypothetical protein